ncbi:helix-turn-helix domain-containing protein [uncultured Sulfitobacter sp.]|uniref:helix-turn-helix domain-containing protein n=1 Tax=uncultured Sulfitobacter sp. TaxID=191468 RepID=UPI002618A5B0|nr:helix-turn-helix domain-containing protein [uncultured Sulfitobacter sp.]
MVAAIRAHSVNVRFDTVRLLTHDSTKATESPQALLAVQGAFMSEILDCDPNKGFVAFPVAVFDLELTPGAFRTLAELCRMANAEGQCWPSLAQVGRKLGRSRAAISGYIAELRDVGVITTEEQKMANGYNYRLRYTVTFWKEWRAGLGKSRRRAERTVQPAERPLETKNHIHNNHSPSKPSEVVDILSGWKIAVGKAPYPDFESWPSDTLIARSRSATNRAIPVSDRPISADIDAALSRFFANVGLKSAPPLGIGPALVAYLPTQAALARLICALQEDWQPHWRKPPSKFQLIRLCKALPVISDAATEQKLLKSYLRRWKLYRERLPSAAISATVAA